MDYKRLFSRHCQILTGSKKISEPWVIRLEKNRVQYTNPCILILFCLFSKNPKDWISLKENQLSIQGSCYWTKITGELTKNKKSKTISIPKKQQFTPQWVKIALTGLSKGEDL